MSTADVPQHRVLLLSLGLALMVAALVLPPPAGLALPAWRCAAVAGVMALWWVTEALPLPVTALLPLLLFPLLDLGSAEATAAAYAHPLIFLFFGGFVMGIAIERWGLHLRLAGAVVRALGDGPRRRVAGVMLATAFLSMWLNNTASTLAMLPVALALAPRAGAGPAPLAPALMLGVAYAATIGGLATLVGTAPNAMLAAYLAREHDVVLGFAQWMLLGVPLAVLLLAAAWWVLTRPLRHPAAPLEPLPPPPGPLGAAQRRVAMLFCLLVASWLARPLLERWLPGISDAGIAVAAAFMLFLVPAGADRRALLVWGDLARLPWGVLILFGGGLALAAAMEGSGLAAAIGGWLAPVSQLPLVLAVGLLAAVLVLLTEFASNTAIAAAFLPIAGALAYGGSADAAAYAVPAALATSCGFMLPAGTPPNAIVFAGGHVSARQMARAGIVLNLLAVVLLAVLVPPLLGLVLRG